MEFRKMLKTLYAEQEKRHRFIEQSFRLCGRRRGWDVSREQHLLYIDTHLGLPNDINSFSLFG